MRLSIVIPAKNEVENVKKLYHELAEVLTKLKREFEIIFVDDGSTDVTFEVLKKLHQKDERVKVIKLRRNFGKSAALMAGFDKTAGDVIITLDADLQDDPQEIPRFLEKINAGFDLVVGWKRKRQDSIGFVLPSRFFNWLSSLLTDVKLHDINCGFKAMKKEVVEGLDLYGELYRFIPALAAQTGFRVAEIPVHHRPRQRGRSKYGFEKFWKGIFDLITIVFLTRYLKRPGQFFGTLGGISFLLGSVISAYIAYLRLATGSIQYRYPLLFLGVLLIIVGIQFISTGLLAEMLTYFNRKDEKVYEVEERV